MSKSAQTAKASGELARWSFPVGDWKLDSKRYSLDGPEILEHNRGTASFALTLEGRRIEERATTTLAGRDMLVLNVFAFHPERKQWEVARTDSIHHSFNFMRGRPRATGSCCSSGTPGPAPT